MPVSVLSPCMLDASEMMSVTLKSVVMYFESAWIVLAMVIGSEERIFFATAESTRRWLAAR